MFEVTSLLNGNKHKW